MNHLSCRSTLRLNRQRPAIAPRTDLRFYIQHGYGTAGPFRTEGVAVRESWCWQPARHGANACRFMLLYRGRWHRLYCDPKARGIPHFIVSAGERLAVTGVCP